MQRANVIKRFVTAVGIASAVVGLWTFGLNYMDLRSEIISLRSEVEQLKGREQRLHTLVVALAADPNGGVTFPTLVAYLLEDEAVQIAEEAGLRVMQAPPFDIDSEFRPSGWMGDGSAGTRYLSVDRVSMDVLGTQDVVTRIRYSEGPRRWAGVYWQYPDGNWGDEPGKALPGVNRVSFLARGELGGEVVEFKSGGTRGRRFRDSFERSLGSVVLAQSWTEYSIDLSGCDLSSVIGAFACVLLTPEGRDEATIYVARLEATE